MAIVCKWEIKGTNPTVSERTPAELDDIAKKVDNELDDLFESGSANRERVEGALRDIEANIRYEEALAKKQGIPYIERQIAAAGTGQLSELALRVVRMGQLKKGQIPVEGKAGTFVYEYNEKTPPRIPVVAKIPRVPQTPDSRIRVPVVPTNRDRIPTVPTPRPVVPTVPRVRVPPVDERRFPPPPPRIRIPPPDNRRTPPPPPRLKIPPPPTPTRPKIPPVPAKPLIPSLKGGKSKSRYPMDSFAWKQGFGYWILTPPYSGTIGKDMIFSRERPAGVPIVQGAKSAYESITKLGINVPKGALVDLGIMDIEIKKKGKKMVYRRDVKQRTKLGRPVGLPPGIVGARGR